MAQVEDEYPFGLEARIRADILYELVQPPIELTQREEAIIRWREDLVSLGTVDGASVMKIKQEVPTAYFNHYQLEAPHGVFPFGLKCRRLSDLLEAADIEDDHIVQLEYNPEIHKLNIQIADVTYSLAGVTKDGIRTFSNPDLEHSYELEIHKRVFDKADRITGMVDREITFEIIDGSCSIRASGDTDDAEIVPSCSPVEEIDDPKEVDVIITKSGSDASCVFDRDMIRILRKFIPKSHFQVLFHDNYPMEIIAERLNNTIQTRIVLAPRVTS